MMNDETERRGLRHAALDILNNGLVRFCLGCALAFWIAALAVPGRYLNEIATMILIGVEIVVVVRWLPVALEQLRSGDTSGKPQLMLGITFFTAAHALRGMWSLLWRWKDYPEWMINSPALAFLTFGAIAGAGFMITSPGATTTSVPIRNWHWLLLGVAIGATLLGFTLGSIYTAKEADSAPIVVSNECPDETPIAGNKGRAGWIYHMPGGPYYSQTSPEACFPDEEAARLAGYRPVHR